MSGLRRTRPSDLLPPLVIVAVAVYVLLRTSYSAFPSMHYEVPLPLAVLAVAEFVAARRVRAAVRHDPDAKPMAAIVIARCVALGKASSLAGAAIIGAAIGLLAYVLPEADTISAAAQDARVGALLLGAALAVLAAGLLLERAGVDPGSSNQPPPARQLS